MIHKLLAQTLTLPGSNGSVQVNGPLCKADLGIFGRCYQSIGDVIAGLLLIVFPLAAGMALVYIVIASFQLMFSGGNAETVAAARGKITTSIIGVVIIALAWFITYVVDRFFLGPGGSGFLQ